MPTTPFLDMILDRPEARFRPGETVAGEVRLEIYKKKRYKDRADTYLLQPGVYQHKFAVTIPEDAPGSFSGKGSTGYIGYELNAELYKLGMSGSNCRVTKPLVVPVLKLNCTSHLSDPISKLVEEGVGTYIVRNGFASASFSLERTKYVTGELLLVSAAGQTLTRGSMKVWAHIKQEIRHHAAGKIKTENQGGEKPRLAIELHERGEWSGAVLRVPRVYPSLVGIIEIIYVLTLKVDFSAGKTETISIPITIGTE